MAKAPESKVTLDKLVALCKRRGFVYQAADIYGGLNGVYDFGHLGMLLKQNLRSAWTMSLSAAPGDIIFIEGALLGPHMMWKASGHVDNFTDPLVDCRECNKRFRSDDVDLEKACPHCGKKNWSDVRRFNMMFQTQLGAAEEQSSTAFLRPETAQSIFVNFKNVMSTNRVKLPFGIAQIGKAFRNEITPKQFLFRMREFEQMEMEYFVEPGTDEKWLEYWTNERFNWYVNLGIQRSNLRLRQHKKNELAHYAKDCYDVEYLFPMGWSELEGIANRGDYDLSQHAHNSGRDFSYFDRQNNRRYIPYAIEPAAGVDRSLLAFLVDAYHEETVLNEKRVVLRLNASLAPIKIAVLPLSRKENLIEIAREIFKNLSSDFMTEYDDSQSIGRRYRRQDEIGTPYCVTIDFQTIDDKQVTIRDRNSLAQIRVPIDELQIILRKKLSGENFLD